MVLHRLPSKDVALEVNYRSVGRGAGGVALRRKCGLTLAQHRAFYRGIYGPTPSTIPSKYSPSIVYQDSAEPQGFGARSPRFGLPQSGVSMPGPGSYAEHRAESDERSASGAGSPVGKHGSAAFASRTARLAHPKRIFAAAGPGAYDVERACSPGASATVKPSAVFVEPGPSNVSRAQTPLGPGEYNARYPPSGKSTPISRTGRTDFMPQSVSALGPGSYEGMQPKFRKGVVAGARTTPEPRPPSMSGPGRQSVIPASCSAVPLLAELNEGEQLRLGQSILASQPGTELCSLNIRLPSSPPPPGPGDYELAQAHAAAVGRKTFSSRGSSGFQVGSAQDPSKGRAELPGPADYDTQPQDPWSCHEAAVVFASTSERFECKLAAAPGPAWYSPQSDSKARSFHDQADGKLWVP